MSTIIGQIYQVGESQVFGQNSFQKRELILKTVEEYPQFIKIEFHQGNCTLPDLFEEGQNVKISYNLKGRMYEKDDTSIEFYNSIVGWKIERV